jgi:hypothetical protein
MNTLNETNNQELPMEVLNVDVHNMGLFMFLSMLKCSAMGNYKLNENAYVARESIHHETTYFDAAWCNPKDSHDSLYIEMKTRKIGDYEVRYENRIIDDVMDKIGNLLSIRDECQYIVPIIIYKKEHRSFNRLWEADILMMWGRGGERGHVIGPLLPIKEWHSIIAKAHDVQELMSILDKVDDRWQQEQQEKQEEQEEQEQQEKQEEQEEQEQQEKQEEQEEQEQQEKQEEQEQQEKQEEQEQQQEEQEQNTNNGKLLKTKKRKVYLKRHYLDALKKMNLDQLMTTEKLSKEVMFLIKNGHLSEHRPLTWPSSWERVLPGLVKKRRIDLAVVNSEGGFKVNIDHLEHGHNYKLQFNFDIKNYEFLIQIRMDFKKVNSPKYLEMARSMHIARAKGKTWDAVRDMIKDQYGKEFSVSHLHNILDLNKDRLTNDPK